MVLFVYLLGRKGQQELPILFHISSMAMVIHYFKAFAQVLLAQPIWEPAGLQS